MQSSHMMSQLLILFTSLWILEPHVGAPLPPTPQHMEQITLYSVLWSPAADAKRRAGSGVPAAQQGLPRELLLHNQPPNAVAYNSNHHLFLSLVCFLGRPTCASHHPG